MKNVVTSLIAIFLCAVALRQADARHQHARQAAGAAAQRGLRRQAAHAQREEGRAGTAGSHHRPLRGLRQRRAAAGLLLF